MALTRTGKIKVGSLPPIDSLLPARTETATLALGCFWGPDSLFGCTKGVIRTMVGYTGGTLKNPTYHNLGDHTETVQLDYDPDQTSYERLLWIFWGGHTPQDRVWKRQYMSAVFFHDAEQEKLAKKVKARVEERLKVRLFTEVIPLSEFYIAEDYHQKYHLQGEPDFMDEFSAIYPRIKDLTASTAAARVNGYLGGYGTVESLEAEIDGFGLSPGQVNKLKDIVRGSKRYNPIWV